MKFLIILLWSLNVLADDVLVRECTAAANRYGNGEGDDYISKDCFDWVKSVKLEQNSFSVPDKIQIMGHGNVIFISDFKEGKYLTHIIAGIYSGIKNVGALTASLEHRELYIVQEGELLVYSLDVTGNVGPIRRSKIVGISPVTKVSFKAENQEIVLANTKAEIHLPRVQKSK